MSHLDRQPALAPYAGCFGRPLAAVLADLERFCATLEKWQRMQNLVSRETVAALWERHIVDSLQLLPLFEGQIAGKDPAVILDVGSGGGFPALPLAIALLDRPVRFHLVESRGRKAAFLKAVQRELALPVTVHTRRIEGISPDLGPVDVITARALAPLPLLFAYIAPLCGPGTRAYLHKGREFREEMQQADSVWRYDVIEHGSQVDPRGVVLEVARLTRIA